MKTFFTLALATVVIASGIFFFLNPDMLWKLVPFGGGQPAAVATTTTEAPAGAQMQSYASTTLGVAVRYMGEFRVDETFEYPFSDTKTIPDAVRFLVPIATASSTNLSDDSYISVEQLPNARTCSGDIFMRADVTAGNITDGSTAYSVASSSEAGAGNRYEEIVYAIKNSKPCTAVRYFIHSTVVENYPEGTVRAFDREALLRQFDDIRRSLRLSAGAASAATSTTPTVAGTSTSASTSSAR